MATTDPEWRRKNPSIRSPRASREVGETESLASFRLNCRTDTDLARFPSCSFSTGEKSRLTTRDFREWANSRKTSQIRGLGGPSAIRSEARVGTLVPAGVSFVVSPSKAPSSGSQAERGMREHVPLRTWNPCSSATRQTSSRRRLFPIPTGPETIQKLPSPDAVFRRASVRRASSAFRPRRGSEEPRSEGDMAQVTTKSVKPISVGTPMRASRKADLGQQGGGRRFKRRVGGVRFVR